jgi:hypothetical protein
LYSIFFKSINKAGVFISNLSERIRDFSITNNLMYPFSGRF